jgi:ABC-type uncharacterized transport system substrate-binding protein
MSNMRRRDFISLFGGAAVAWPLAARAQRQTVPVVGFLHASAPDNNDHLVEAFRKGLAETASSRGAMLRSSFAGAHDDPKRYPELAAELVRRQVAVIVTPIGTAVALAAKAAIVFSMGTDPGRRASSRATTGRVAMSPASAPWLASWVQNGLGSCLSCGRKPRASASWLT